MSDSDSSFLEQNCTFKKTQTKNYLILYKIHKNEKSLLLVYWHNKNFPWKRSYTGLEKKVLFLPS